MLSLLEFNYTELKKTKKLFIIPVLFFLFACMSPLTSKYMNQLLIDYMEEDGMMIIIPDPTMMTSYEQYMSDLFEIVFLIVIFMAVSYFIHDKIKGGLPLILSKPIKGRDYVLAKIIAFTSLIGVSLVVSHLVFSFYTYYLYGQVDFAYGFVIIGLYLLVVIFIASVAMFFSVYTSTFVATLIATFVVYLIGFGVDTFNRFTVIKYLPGSVLRHLGNYPLMNNTQDIIITVIITLSVSAILLGFTVHRFDNQDLA